MSDTLNAMLDEHAPVIEGSDETTAPDITTGNTQPNGAVASPLPQQPQQPGPDQQGTGGKRAGDGKAQPNAAPKPDARSAQQPQQVTPEAFQRLQHSHGAIQRQSLKLQQDLRTAETELKAYREANALPQQLGLSPADVAAAMQFMADWKKDPAKTARFVLTEAQALGHTIDATGGGIPMDAIAKMLDERLKPFQQDRSSRQQEIEQAAAIDREIAEVTADFPWLTTQDAEVTKVLQSNPGMPLREVALRMENFALREGLDVSKPLEPQYLAKRNGTLPMQQQRPNAARVPAPGAAIDVPMGLPNEAAAPSNVSNREIVRRALRSAGLNPDV